MVVNTGDGNFIPNTADSGPSIFSALAKIGLKLESRKASQTNIVVDHIVPPSRN